MTTPEHGCHHQQPWEHFGRAAEKFARRVSDDAKLFAERVEEHVGDLARDVRREWQSSSRPGAGGSNDDVRRIFDDVRGIVRGVLDGVDRSPDGIVPRGWRGRVVEGRAEREATWGAASRSAQAPRRSFDVIRVECRRAARSAGRRGDDDQHPRLRHPSPEHAPADAAAFAYVSPLHPDRHGSCLPTSPREGRR